MQVIDMPTTEVNESGGNCLFYTDGIVGLKLWKSWVLAKEQFVNQRTASRYNAGPKVIGHDLVKVKGRNLYGFYTELAKLHWPYTNKELRNLDARFKRAFGVSYPDLHDENIGHVNGKLVFIDFDRITRE